MDRVRDRDERTIDRLAWWLLGAACAASAGLLLYLNRGTTLFFDELIWFADLSSYGGPDSVLEPHNSHLHGTTRAAYYLVMETIGFDYLAMRLMGVFTVLACAILMFVIAKRRIPTPVALGIAIILLFYGSAWQHVVGPIGFTVLGSIAAGLGALLMLERGDRRGDIAACALTCLSVFTFTTGLAFLVGVAVSVLLRKDRLRRAWIFLVPLGLYGAWYLWALQFDEGRTAATNLDGVPEFFSRSLAVVSGALTGVNVPFSRFEGGPPAAVTSAEPSILGYLVGFAFLAAVVWRIGTGKANASIYVSIAIVSTYWLAAALAQPIFFETQSAAVRYVYPGSIGLLLVATDAARGLRLRPGPAMALLAVGAFSLAMNLVFLRDGARYLRDEYSKITRANLAAVELAASRDRIDATEQAPSVEGPERPRVPNGPPVDEYLASVKRYGSPAFSLEELGAQPPVVRLQTDLTLIADYKLVAAPGPAPPRRSECIRASGPQQLALEPGDVFLRSVARPAKVSLSRFAPERAETKLSISDAEWSVLSIPADDAPDRWKLGPGEGETIRACYPPGVR